MFLIQKYTQYKAAQAEQQKRKVTEKELAQLNHKIDKLLSKLDEHEPELANNQDEECVVCVHAKATMQTYPCGHRVVCRKCFVKTIQMAVAQRLLPLRCVMCRAKILRLKHTAAGGVHSSASQYTINGGQWYHVPQSASLYSVTSSTSGVSGVSSASSCSSASSYKTCSSSFSAASLKSKRSYSSYSKMGYQPLRTSSPSPSRSPHARPGSGGGPGGGGGGGGGGLMAKKDNKVCPVLDSPVGHNSLVQNNGREMPKGKLTLIREFQREYRHGKEQSQQERKLSAGGNVIGGSSYKPGSTRIKCARLLVSQAQSSCSDIPTPTGNAPSSGIMGGKQQATTPTSSTSSGRTMMRKSESLSGTPSSSATASKTGISRSTSMAAAAACASSSQTGKKTGSQQQQRATTPTTTTSSQQPPSSQSCPSLRLSRRDSSNSTVTATNTTTSTNSSSLSACTPGGATATAAAGAGVGENQRKRESGGMACGPPSREILSASGLTVRFGGGGNAGCSGLFPTAKSRTPAGAGGGVASIPLLSK